MTASALLDLVVHSTHVELFGLTLFGAFAMHVFQQYKGFTGSIGFLKAAFPARSAVFYVRLDLCIVVLFRVGHRLRGLLAHGTAAGACCRLRLDRRHAIPHREASPCHIMR